MWSCFGLFIVAYCMGWTVSCWCIHTHASLYSSRNNFILWAFSGWERWKGSCNGGRGSSQQISINPYASRWVCMPSVQTDFQQKCWEWPCLCLFMWCHDKKPFCSKCKHCIFRRRVMRTGSEMWYICIYIVGHNTLQLKHETCCFKGVLHRFVLSFV